MILELTYERQLSKEANEEKLKALQEYLHNHYYAWITADELMNVLGFTNIRFYINKLRNEGLPILSSNKGYKISNDPDEILECYNKLRIRALLILSAAKNMKMYL